MRKTNIGYWRSTDLGWIADHDRESAAGCYLRLIDGSNDHLQVFTKLEIAEIDPDLDEESQASFLS